MMVPSTVSTKAEKSPLPSFFVVTFMPTMLDFEQLPIVAAPYLHMLAQEAAVSHLIRPKRHYFPWFMVEHCS
jgi:hypothetical protein